MKTQTTVLQLVLVLVLMVPSCISYSQINKKNSVGVSVLGLPPVIGASAAIISAEFERFISDHNSIAARFEYITYSYDDKGNNYREIGDGSGGGIGFSFKHYFSDNGSGFYIGPAVETVIMNGTYFYSEPGYGESGESTSIALCPNFIAGYRFNFGDTFSLTPAIMLGYRVGFAVATSGDFDGESGLLAGIGAKFAWSF